MPGSPADSATIAAVLGTEDASATMEAAATSFALEAQLRDFIAENLSRIPVAGTTLQVFTDPNGRGGVEYPTGVGPIDILAADSAGNLYVFELKLDRGPDRALGQLARYMGWVKSHLAAGKTVTGVLVARSIDERLRYAAAVIPNVALLEYEVQFTVRPIEAHGSTASGAV
jgi:RecB family endonuclease NucS